MHVLIRFIRRLESGAVEHHDRVFVGDRLTLGRSTSQDIHLRDRRVALEHAEIRSAGKGFEIITHGISGITVNDTFCRKAPINDGDAVFVGSNILRFIPPPEGSDLAFTFELDPEVREAEAEGAPVRDRLLGQAPSKRAWSWGMFLGVFLIFLLVPLLVFEGGEVASVLRGTPLPGDKLWLSGPLHPTHQLEIGDDCSACHEKPFVQVKDSACLACHERITHHVSVADRKHEDMETWRCQTCHKEHNEPAQLVLAEDKLCADCHLDVKTIAVVNKEMLKVGSFEDKHPQFRVSMMSPVATEPGSWEIERIDLDDTSIHERSGLNFPHAKHLVADGVPGPDGNQVLQCADCHEAELSGEYFKPIRMREHCQSCHVLEFDEAVPGRQVPHASPDEVMTMLQEYFASAMLTGRLATKAQGREIRIPGKIALSVEEKRETLEEAQKLADVRFDELIEGVCMECHEPAEAAHAGASNGMPELAPIRLTEHWMPKAHFGHASHIAGQQCGDCHAAISSEQSSDVLMPGIEQCRDCHVKNLASTCMTCHGLHLVGAGLMSEKLVKE